MKRKQRKKSGERTKIVPKFKILDAVIILLIVISIVGLYLGYDVMDTLKNRKEMKEYVVSFSIENIRNSTKDYINIGDIVYYAEDGEQLGEFLPHTENVVQPLSYHPASVYVIDENGAAILIDYPYDDSPDDRIDASGRFLCQGSYSDDVGFLVNGSRYLAPGQKIEVRTDRVTLTVTIQDIALKEVSQ